MSEWFYIAALLLKISVMVQVFAIGTGTTWRDTTYLFRQPVLLGKSILSRNIAVPILAIVLIKTFELHPAVAISLGVLSVTPVPPLLPVTELKEGARSEFVLGLIVSQAVLSVAIVPLTILFLDRMLEVRARFSPAEVAIVIIETILVPLLAGEIASYFFPKLRSFAARVLGVASVIVLIGAVPLFYVAWRAMLALSNNSTIPALGLFVLGGTVVGHFLGGPRWEDRETLAIATSSRHPGIAIAVAQANFPQWTTLVAGTVMIYLVVRAVFLLPYAKWHRVAPAI